MTDTTFNGVYGYDKEKKTILVKIGNKLHQRRLRKDITGQFFVIINNRYYSIDDEIKVWSKK